MSDLKQLRDRCDMLLAAANVSGDTKRINQLNEIKQFLAREDSFLKVDQVKCIYFLVRLGYDFEEANEIYNKFNKIELLPGILEYTDNKGNVFQKEALLCPKIDDYYMFDNGLIFKFDNMEKKFYALINGQWVHDGSIQKKFYSSEYNYERIKYKINEKKNSNKR